MTASGATILAGIVEDGERALAMLLIAGDRGQLGHRLGIPLLDLGQRLGAVDLFEPEIGVAGLSECGGGGGRGEREKEVLDHGAGR